MKHKILFALVFAVAMLSSACSQRYIMDVDDHPKGHATTMRTIDVKNFIIMNTVKDVFWECQEDGNGLRCTKSCDRPDNEGNKIVCPVVRSAGPNPAL
jgi:hypothetical protein